MQKINKILVIATTLILALVLLVVSVSIHLFVGNALIQIDGIVSDVEQIQIVIPETDEHLAGIGFSGPTITSGGFLLVTNTGTNTTVHLIDNSWTLGIGTTTTITSEGLFAFAVYGSTSIQTPVNTANAFRIQNAASSTVFSVNTIDGSAALSGVLTVSSCIGCAVGAGDVFAWTSFSDRNATSTLLDFQQGFLSGASSTINATTTIAGNSIVGNLDGNTYDLHVYSNDNASSSIIKMGHNRLEGTLAGNIGNINFTDTAYTKLIEVPKSETYYVFLNTDDEVRFALAEPGVDKGTYSPRSMIIAGPWTDNANFIKCSFWGFWAIACDTGSTGADLAVQNDLQVLGSSYFAETLTASSTIVEGLSILTGGFISTASSTVSAQFHVSGNLSASSSVAIDGAITAGGALTVTGLTTLNGGLTLETGDIFTFNGDAFTSFTSDGTLSIVSNALRVVDVICTNCLNATEIEDIYLLDDGDIGTGVFDFGGATSFEIPNGANPTVDIAGEIAIDTTTGQLIFHDGAVKQVLSATSTKSFTITSPDGLAQKEYDLWHLPYAITITDISCNVDALDQRAGDQPESIILNPYERNGLTATATTTIDGNFTCDNNGATDDNVFTNASLDAGDLFGIFIGTASGTPDYVQMSIDYIITAD